MATIQEIQLKIINNPKLQYDTATKAEWQSAGGALRNGGIPGVSDSRRQELLGGTSATTQPTSTQITPTPTYTPPAKEETVYDSAYFSKQAKIRASEALVVQSAQMINKGSTAVNDYYYSLSEEDRNTVKPYLGSQIIAGYRPSTGNVQQTNIGSTGTQYAGGLQPDDPSNKYNTATGQINPNYNIDKVVDAPTDTGATAPEFGETTGEFDNDAFYSSLVTQAENTKQQIEIENTRRYEEDQKRIDQYKQEIDELNQLQAEGLGDQATSMLESKQRSLDALEEGNAIFRKAQQDKIELGNQMQNLLTQGQDLIKQQKSVTGLDSIRTPRINQTIADVNAQAGIIQAALNAKQGDMNSAYGVLDATAKATSIYLQEELNYYSSVQNFHETQKGEAGVALNLDREQKEYLDFKLNTLKADLANIESNKAQLQELFTDPDTASLFAKSGISMTTPQSEWGAKIAKYESIQEIADFKNEKISEGYTYKPAGNGNTSFTVGGKTLSFDAPVDTPSDTPTDELKYTNAQLLKLRAVGIDPNDIETADNYLYHNILPTNQLQNDIEFITKIGSEQGTDEDEIFSDIRNLIIANGDDPDTFDEGKYKEKTGFFSELISGVGQGWEKLKATLF